MAFATSHNGGRAQVNGNGIQTGGDFPFLNFFKTCQMLSYPNIDAGAWIDPTTLDADGYPTTLPAGGCDTVIFVPSQSDRPGDMAVTWDGTGVVKIDGSITSGNTSTSGVTFTPSGTRLVIGIVSTSASPNHVRNIKLYYVSDATAVGNGDVFSTVFKNKLLEGGFGVYRFLNWQNANFSNVTTWAMRKPITYYSYNTSQTIPSLVCTGCTNSGNAYSITGNGLGVPASGSPADKQLIQMQFNEDATGTPTLNLNGTGAKPILNKYSNVMGSSTWPTKLQPMAVSSSSKNFCTLMYDATLASWIKCGGDGVDSSQGLINGCPPEIMFQLCAELGAHPYFVTPPFAIDPATDYMPNLAAYCRDNAPSWMVPRFETCNESFTVQFINYNYGINKATAYAALDAAWSGGDQWDWQGKVSSVLGQIVSAVYSADRTRYHVLHGVQTTAPPLDRTLNSTAYVGQTLAAQSPYTKTAAKGWATGIAVNQYFNPGADASTGSVPAYGTQLAAEYANGSPYAVGGYIRTCFGASSGFNVAAEVAQYVVYKAWAQSMGINYMTGYEGAYGPDYDSNGTSDMDKLRAAGKAHPDCGAALLAIFKTFVGLSDSTFTADFPSAYLMSENGTGNVWPILNGIYQTPDPPQWTALRQFSGKRAMDLRLRIHG